LRNFDWRHREVIDAIAIIGFLALMYVVSDAYDLPAKLFQFVQDHADWEVDDIIFVALTLSVTLLVYVNRRRRDLANEINARHAAEAESYRLARHNPLTGLPNRRFLHREA
jgi:hypothetical protein